MGEGERGGRERLVFSRAREGRQLRDWTRDSESERAAAAAAGLLTFP